MLSPRLRTGRPASCSSGATRGSARPDSSPKSPNERARAGPSSSRVAASRWATAAAFRSPRSSRRSGGCRQGLPGSDRRARHHRGPALAGHGRAGAPDPRTRIERRRRSGGVRSARMDPGPDLRGRAVTPPVPWRASAGPPDPRGPPLGRWLDPRHHVVPRAKCPNRAVAGRRDLPDRRAEPPPSTQAVARRDGAPAARPTRRAGAVRSWRARGSRSAAILAMPHPPALSQPWSAGPRAIRSSSRNSWHRAPMRRAMDCRRRSATSCSAASRRYPTRATPPRRGGGGRSHGGCGPAREVAGSPEAELEDAVHDALAAQILVNDPSSRAGAYRFRHALLAEAVYDDLLPSERRRLHAAYAEALDTRPTPDGAEGANHLAALAHHASAAHEPVRALRAWVAAARAARRRRLRGGPACLRTSHRPLGRRAGRRPTEGVDPRTSTTRQASRP